MSDFYPKKKLLKRRKKPAVRRQGKSMIYFVFKGMWRREVE